MSAIKKTIDEDILEMLTQQIRSYKAKGYSEQVITFKLRKRFEVDEIKYVFKTLEETEGKKSSCHSLKDDLEYYGWYEGPNENAKGHWSRLKQQLSTKKRPWSKKMIDSLDKASTSVVSHLAPPKSESSIQAKGLVLGYIQSGKTANFSATIAKAVDEGYKLVIVLAGLHNNLRKQTEVRLRQELVDPIGGVTCTTLTDVDDKGDFKSRQPVSANSQLSRKEGFILVVLKKNSSVLRNFKNWLADANDDIVKDCPTLIIDDEADQASINTKKDNEKPTAINGHIRELLQKFKLVSYVGYTATPFANAFVDSNVKDDVFPKDFLVSLDKPETYYGPEELFGRNYVNGNLSEEGMPLIRDVPIKDAYHLSSKVKEKDYSELLTESAKNAVNSFLIGSCARLCRGQWREHMTMLVHLSHLNAPQKAMKNEIEEYLKDIENFLEDDNEVFKNRLYNLWRNDFAVVTKEVTNSLDHDFEKIYKNLLKFVKRIEVIEENSQSKKRLSFDARLREGDPLWGIIVGGNTLSRGLTVEGLTTSYFVRHSKFYDSLLQMGRWFGYRAGYVDLTRIYVTEELYRCFYELATIEQEIRDEIKLMSNNKEKPINVALKIRKVPGLHITASNKRRNAIVSKSSYSGQKIQTFQLAVNDKKTLVKNFSTVEALFTKLKNKNKKQEIAFDDLNQNHLFTNVKSEDILQFLDKYIISKNNIKYSKSAIQSYISNQNTKNELNNWSVALMSNKKGDKNQLAGLEYTPLKRSTKNTTLDSEAILRAVSVPGDELIDLAGQLKSNYKNTKDLLLKSKLTDVEVRKRFRSRSCGLLLIYPIESNTDMTAEDYQNECRQRKRSYPLKAAHQAFAVSIVFPYSNDESGGFNYFKNETI